MNYNNNNFYDASNTIVSGNSIVVDTNCNASEIKADIKVSEFDSLRLWGQVINCNGHAVSNVLVKLMRIVCTPHGESYQGIAHTITDCNGFYQFELCREDKNSKYKVLVSKAATGPELVHTNSNGECNTCNTHQFDPCKQYAPIPYEYDYNNVGGVCNNNHGDNHFQQSCNNYQRPYNYEPLAKHQYDDCKSCHHYDKCTKTQCDKARKVYITPCNKCGSTSGRCNCKTSTYTASNQCGSHF